MRRAAYDQTIREVLAEIGQVGAADPRHIEGYMRLEHPTLDGLARWQFRAEVEIALACIAADGLENAEACAQSYGF